MAEGQFGRPDPNTVSQFHTFDDVDANKDSHHHTIGTGTNQAASGSHTHNGSDSSFIIPGTAITGTKATVGWAASVNAILVAMGAVDNST